MLPARLLRRPLCPPPALPSHPVRLASTVARLLDLPASGATVSIRGWVRSVRQQKHLAFAAVGDGSSLAPLQVVLTPEQAAGLSTGVAVSISGQWRASPSGKQQACELHAHAVRLLGHNDAAAYPLQKKYHSPEFLRTLPHLRTRIPFNSLLLRLRSQVIGRVTTFFAGKDFVQTHPPIITSSDCEGAGQVFSVASQGNKSQDEAQRHDKKPEEHFFKTPKYLTVSSQLHLEALAQSVGSVWTLSPAFRAEKSDTPRHLSEFYMLEAEIGFVERLDHVMDIVEEMLRDVAINLTNSTVGRELLHARSAGRSREDEVAGITSQALSRRWEGLCKGPWPRISYAEAVLKIRDAESQGKARFEVEPSFEDGLQAEHERFLADHVGQGGPVFVTDYPRAVKPFYMAPSARASGPDPDPSTVACFDLLVPEICELVGGSMREHRLPELLAAMDAHGLQRPGQSKDARALADAVPERAPGALLGSESDLHNDSGDLKWYADLRQFGSVPHGGFGIGFDRLLGYLSGVSNIRDVVGFPRWYQRCDC